MIYKAKEPKFLWLILLLISLSYAFFLQDTYRLAAILLSGLFAVLMFSHYKLNIEDDQLIFSWYVAGVKVFRRQVAASVIKKILFITSSRQTIVLVQLNEGFRLKLQRFKPTAFIDDLDSFARKHHINTEETNFIKQKS